MALYYKENANYVLKYYFYFYQAAVAVKVSILFICFCGFDLSCPIYEKYSFIENCIVLSR